MNKLCQNYGNGRTSPPKTTEVTRGRYPKTTEVIYGSKPPYPLHTTSVKTDCRCDAVWELCAGEMKNG
jgi:hypothetical protein